MTVRGEILADRQLAVETRMLKDDAKAAAHRGGLAREIVAEQARAARLNRRQRREQFEQRGLAAAVGSEEAEDFAAGNRERHVSESLPIAVAKAKRIRLDRSGLGAKRVVGSARRTGNGRSGHGWPSPPAGCVDCSGSPISARCHPS